MKDALKKLTSDAIAARLLYWACANTSEIVLPNYYVGTWEMDVCKISKAGQMTEYEIKVSRADFKKDFTKARSTYLGARNDENGNRTYNMGNETKHQVIQSAKRCNRFYYVVPENLVKPDEIPDGLGLIYAFIGAYGIDFKIVKISKLFKKEPVTEQQYRHIACNLVLKLQNAKRTIQAFKSSKIK